MRISKDDILNALGFETKTSGYADMFLMFGAGLIAGAAVGLLLAPKTGSELRSDVVEKAGNIVSNVKSKIARHNGEHDLPSAGV
jgi:hypothetical protein